MRRLQPPDAAGREAQAPAVQHLHGDLEAAPRLAEHVAHGHARVLEVDRRRVAAADAELVLRRARAHAVLPLDDEGGDAGLAAGLGGGRAREDREDVGEAAVADPDLVAVQDVALAVLGQLGLGLDARRVAAGAGLREREGRDPLAARQARQVLLLLRLGAEQQDGLEADGLVRPERHAEGRVDGAELLDDARVGGRRQADAAVVARDVHAEQAELLHAGDDPLRDERLAVDLHAVHLAGAEVAHGVEDHAQVVGLVLGHLRVGEDQVLRDDAVEDGLHEALLGGHGGCLLRIAFIPDRARLVNRRRAQAPPYSPGPGSAILSPPHAHR
jgi:hypothetical protein